MLPEVKIVLTRDLEKFKEQCKFRKGTQNETAFIADYIRKRAKIAKRSCQIWGTATGLFSAVIIFSAAVQIITGGILVESIIVLVVGLLFFLIPASIFSEYKKILRSLDDIMDERYEVLDCHGYNWDFSVRLNGEAITYIENENGVRCSHPFVLDLDTAKKSKEYNYPLLAVLTEDSDYLVKSIEYLHKED